MGQKVHPYGFRLGFNKTWRSRWYSDRDYAKLLHEDLALRSELKRRFAHAGVSRVDIERAASEALYRIKDRAFESAAAAVRDRKAMTEYDLQQQMVGWFGEEGLVSDSAPVVAIGANAGDPHYLPTARACRPLTPDEVLLLDLWGKRQEPGAVFADITWVAVTGSHVPIEAARAFEEAQQPRSLRVTPERPVREGRRLCDERRVHRPTAQAIATSARNLLRM